MPVTSAKMYGLMQAAAHGGARKGGPSPEVAREMIHKTPPEKRKAYAKAIGHKIANRRR